MYYIGSICATPSDELMHHGIKGQKWGIRRYQNPDGTLTAQGKARYEKVNEQLIKRHTFFSGDPDFRKKADEEYASRERGKTLATKNKKFFKEQMAEMKRIDESDMVKEFRNIENQLRDLREERKAFKQSSRLNQMINKRKGQEMEARSKALWDKSTKLGTEWRMVSTLATQELAKMHFSKKDYKDVEAYIAEMFDYQMFD